MTGALTKRDQGRPPEDGLDHEAALWGIERVIGLRYGDATVGLRNAGIEVTPALWTDLQMVEIGARAAMNGEAI